MSPLRSLAPFVVAGWTLFAGSAFAQSAEDAARKAFADAQAAEQAGDPRLACTHYRTSLASLRAPGILERVARCDALDSHYVAAIAGIDEALGMLTSDNVEDQTAYTALRKTWQSKLARFTMRAKPGATLGVVTLDGAPSAADGRVLELDPGEHTVVVDGRSKTLSLASGDNPSLEVPLPDPGAKPPERPAPARPPTAADDRGLSGQQTAAIVSFGVGALALGGAAVTGVMALDNDATAESTCATARDAACRTAVDDTNALLVPNLALWIVGGVGAAAGATFLLLDGSDSSPSAQASLRVGPAGVSFQTAF